MKKIIFLSLVMMLMSTAFPVKVGAQATGGCPGFSPTRIKNSDDSVTFKVNSLSPNTRYEVTIDVGTTLGTGMGNPSMHVTTDGSGNLSAPFTRAVHGDGVFALEPDNFNDVIIKREDRSVICKSTYAVISACRFDFSPRDISTDTDITITGESLPLTPQLGVTQFIRAKGPFTRDFNIDIESDKKFTRNIGKLETIGVYNITLNRRYIKIDPTNVTPVEERIAFCDQFQINVGPPANPAPNRPPGGGGGIGPGGRTIVSCKGSNTNIDTAIGCIPVDTTEDFVAWILGWFIGISGGIAFLLMLWAGFQIMTASGNPDQAKAGKEQLTAAISGLTLIIFSIFLLRLIGVNILSLPGIRP